MLALRGESLPDHRVRRILILRTARTPQIQWALDQLRAKYPEAEFGVLGTQLGGNELFAGMEHFEPSQPWLSPRSVRRLRSRLRKTRFDMVVMCLNGDCGTGYGGVSRVVRRIDAPFKFVAGYTGRWHKWDHMDFEEGNVLTRGLVNCLGILIYPLIATYLLLVPSRPRYMPGRQGATAPGYEA